MFSLSVCPTPHICYLETWEINHGKVDSDMHVGSLLQVFVVWPQVIT